MTIALGSVITFAACNPDDDGDPCEGLTGIELANCRDAQL